jgi:hypothetical protein
MDEILDYLVEISPILILVFALIYIFHETLRFIKGRDKLMLENQQYAAKYSQQTGSGSRQASDLARLQLQAAERFTLYLERISPDRLVMRLHQSGMTAKMLQNEMTKAIREEFDHNLSQQIYVSEGAWELIKNAKEEITKFISATGDSMTQKSSGIDLSRKLFEAASQVETLPNEIALQYLRKETRKLLKS